MTTTERWQWLVLILVGGGLIYLLAPALTPFAQVISDGAGRAHGGRR